MSESPVTLYGIRHHGPGSARSLVRALNDLAPDILLVEGPPDAQDVLPLAAAVDMKPPVALLVYRPDSPQSAVFYPFARFSPEWQAIRYALERNIPARFIDLPQWHRLAAEDEAGGNENGPAESDTVDGHASGDPGHEDEPAGRGATAPDMVRLDPLGCLADAAGFTDGERWWDHLVESRRGGDGEVFQAIAEAMTTLRESTETPDALLEQRREAHMRQGIRAALGERFERIAVVCGAWHVPALAETDARGRVSVDQALLKGLPKTRTAAAWVPWSYDRLSMRSGYGAGVVSPEWYDLLWSGKAHLPVRWLTRVARLMRKQDLDASSADVIEAARLADTLAAMRGRPLPGLEELDEAALSVMCFGNDAPMALVRERLVVGNRLGQVPEDAPVIPLQKDLAALQKRLRLTVSADEKDYDLDLRKPNDLARSHLLHRLRVLGIPWGEPQKRAGGKGTFHEYWRLRWKVDFAVALVDAGRWGNTVAEAASRRAADRSDKAENLSELAELVGELLLADLPGAVESVLRALQDRSAVSSDVPQLMGAVPPLTKISRYGNVRQTDSAMVLPVVDGMVARICVGLPPACASLDDEAASTMRRLIQDMNGALILLRNDEHLAMWHRVLARLAEQAGLHGLLAGYASRLLREVGRVDEEELSRRIGMALSRAADPGQAAAWIEGVLADSGLVLIHDERLLAVVDSWLSGLSGEHFTAILPMLRRTFSTFPPPERRQIGERLRSGPAAARAADGMFDHERADAVLPTLSLLLGLDDSDRTSAEGG